MLRILCRRPLWLVAWLFVPVPALAIINPCFSIGAPGVTTSDGVRIVHPRSSDNIWFAVTVDNMFVRPYTGPPQSLLTRVSTEGNDFTIDVIVTTDRTPFPDYHTATISGDPSMSVNATGQLGTLPAGDYSITGSVRVYNPSTGALELACSPGQQSSTFTIYATSGIAPVIEFYNAKLDHYFITQNADEIRDLDTGVHPGWARTGQSFLAFLPGQSSLLQINRFYGLPSAGLDTHFYTYGGSAEDFNLRVGPPSASWELETYDAFELYMPDMATGTCRAGTIPVYRLWNGRKDSNHRYTADPATKAAMIERGYIPEGWGDDGYFFCALAGD